MEHSLSKPRAKNFESQVSLIHWLKLDFEVLRVVNDGCSISSRTHMTAGRPRRQTRDRGGSPRELCQDASGSDSVLATSPTVVAAVLPAASVPAGVVLVVCVICAGPPSGPGSPALAHPVPVDRLRSTRRDTT